ncbi:neural cell adhesion molecule 1-like isoform X2 [Oratosquilla oratoria]|uniref:neural cell adhesion molecule 1-like isoform X2 n=1 Tax=Oratosquilla oratoria TaxID=337810 RepID=UPI003F772B95
MPTLTSSSIWDFGRGRRNTKNQTTSWSWTSTQFLFIVVLLFGLVDDGESTPWLQHNDNHDYDPLTPHDLLPAITTKPLHFEVNLGSNVTFPCDIQNLADKSVTWRRGEEILWLMQKKPEGTVLRQAVDKDARLHIQQGTMLELRQVRSQDQGNYTCEVSSGTSHSTVTHHLTVRAPPSVEATYGHSVIREREGDAATLACTATGQPTPTITWSKKNGVLPQSVVSSSSAGPTLTIHSTRKEDAGVYVCTASNSVGADDQAYVELLVMHAPEIHPRERVVYSGVGYDAVLSCVVQAYPQASVKWFRKGAPADPMRLTFSMKSSKEKSFLQHLYSVPVWYSLYANRVLKEDFGVYTCNASNYMGNDSAAVELTGRPSPVQIVSLPDSEYDTMYKVVWEVESYAPILNFILSYRNLTDGEDAWFNLTVPGASSPSSMYLSQSYTLESLDSGAEYAVIIWARNEFGFSEPSDVFQFRTMEITGSTEAPDDVVDLPEHQEQGDQGLQKSKEEEEEKEEAEEDVAVEDGEEEKWHSEEKGQERRRNSTDGATGAPGGDEVESSVKEEEEESLIAPQVLNDMGTPSDAGQPGEQAKGGAEAAKLDETSSTGGAGGGAVLMTPREKRAQMTALVTAISLSTFFW